MAKKKFTPSDSSLPSCENLDICYEVIKVHEMMWNIFLWAYTTMNVNEFLTPFIAANEDGYRTLRPNQGAGQRSLISSRVRAVLSMRLESRSIVMSAIAICRKNVLLMVYTTFVSKDFMKDNNAVIESILS